MNLSNQKSRSLFATRLVFVAVFAVLSFTLAIPPANAATEWRIKDDATGGDCSSIGAWDAPSKTCHLSQDLEQGIVIDSDGVTLDGNGHAVTGDGTGNGVYASQKTDIRVRELSVSNFDYGINLCSVDNALVSYNTVSNNHSFGIVFNASAGVATCYGLGDASNNVIEHNTLSSQRRHVAIGNVRAPGGENIVRNNSIEGGGQGVFLWYNNGSTVAHNTIHNVSDGIALSYSNDTTVENNVVSNDSLIAFPWFGGRAIALYGSASTKRNEIRDNRIEKYAHGIFIGAQNNKVFRNSVIDGHLGLLLITGSTGNQIYQNNFINRISFYGTQYVLIEAGVTGNFFDLEAPVGGNYWSNFDTPEEGCNDANYNGFCDSPYVFSGGQDNLPWTKKDGWIESSPQPSTTPTFQFPIEGFDPYTAEISSILDYSGTPLDGLGVFNCNRSGSCNGIVKAFNGEIGSKEFGKNDYPPGYPKDADGTSFFENKFTQTFQNNIITEKHLEYKGAGSEQCFDKNGNPIDKCFLNEAYLNYDGHSGYDYKFELDTPIRASAKGKLYKADGPDDDPINGHPTAATPWDNFHTFYIDHGNGYTTWYLHANKLNEKVEDMINQNPQKYAEVSPDDIEPIAYTGNYCQGCSMPPHFHFEVRYNGEIVDPYDMDYTLWKFTPSNYLAGQIHSPGELRVYDSEGRVTGLVNGEEKNEIPESEYGSGGFIIYNPKNDYRYEIVGTDNGTYDLDITSASENSYIKFEAKDIQIESNEIHQYEINWDILSQGEEGVTLQIDTDGDGVFEQTIKADATLQPPTADINGPYEGNEGSSITFDASSSSDPDGEIILYEWDFDGDGVYDTASVSSTIARAWGDDYQGEIILRVTDDEGLTDTAMTSVIVKNVAPIISNLSVNELTHPNQEIWAGDTLNLSGDFTDDGWLDTHTAEWNFGDETTAIGAITQENNPPAATGQAAGNYVYYNAGTYTITLAVTDDDGGVSVNTLQIAVKPIPAAIDCNPETLNLKSGGKWITCYIELSAGYDVRRIDGSAVFLNGAIPIYLGKEGWAKPEPNKSNIMDHDEDGILERMVKFDRETVQDILESGEAVVLTITGKVFYNQGLADFEGQDTIKVIEPDKLDEKEKPEKSGKK